MRDELRSVVQENSSFYNFNGQPGLSPGCWPDTLSWPQTKKAFKRNYNKAAYRYPEVAAEIYNPRAFPDENPKPEMDDPEVAEPEVVEPEVAEPEVDVDEDDVVIPPLEELLANPIPSTSRGIQFRPKKKPFVKTPFPICKMGSLLTYGRKLFIQGADIDELIENVIGARRLSGAQKEIASQIANLIDRLKYLNGRRSRLLETLEAQQSRLDKFVNFGIDTPQKCRPTGKLPDPVQFWKSIHGLTDPEMSQDQDQPPAAREQETETEVSRYYSNLSDEGVCAPGDCKCTDKKCEDYNYTD